MQAAWVNRQIQGGIKEKKAMADAERTSGGSDDLHRTEEEMLWESREIAEVIIESVPT